MIIYSGTIPGDSLEFSSGCFCLSTCNQQRLKHKTPLPMSSAAMEIALSQAPLLRISRVSGTSFPRGPASWIPGKYSILRPPKIRGRGNGWCFQQLFYKNPKLGGVVLLDILPIELWGCPNQPFFRLAGGYFFWWTFFRWSKEKESGHFLMGKIW